MTLRGLRQESYFSRVDRETMSKAGTIGRTFAALVLFAGLLLPEAALAEDPPRAVPVTVSDAVITKTGTMFRGTIVESSPDGPVKLLLVTGEVKKFARSEIKYAGAAAKAPGQSSGDSSSATTTVETPPEPPKPTPPEPTAAEKEAAKLPPKLALEAGMVTLTLTSSQPGVSFFAGPAVDPGMSKFLDGAKLGSLGPALCAAPCTTTMKNGKYQFGLSTADGGYAIAREPVTIEGPMTLEGRYISNQGTRTAGWVLLIVGSSLGAGLIIHGSKADSPSTPERLMGGVIGLAGSGACVFFLCFKNDVVSVSATPTVSAGSTPKTSRSGPSREAIMQETASMNGVGLSGLF
jgi:hypothetical protein